MIRLLRLFSLISFVAVMITAMLLTLLYRQEIVRATVALARATNLALAQAALDAAQSELDDYYAALGARDGSRDAAARRLSERIRTFLADTASDGSATNINLYDRRGLLVLTSDPADVGAARTDHPAFASALVGRAKTHLHYRDAIDLLARPAGEANVMQTYVPVRAAQAKSIEGVLEVSTDVAPLVAANERTLLLVLAGAALILMSLYAVLAVVVRRARQLVESLVRSTRARSAAQETVSAAMIRSDEMERKRLASGLHEGLAQTLTAIKMRVEASLNQLEGGEAGDGALAAVVPVLQGAIMDVESIATGLRPASLDDLGLVPTLQWFCRDFHERHPRIAVEHGIGLAEDDTPAGLKIVVYRVVEAAFRSIARFENADAVELDLRRIDRAIVLTIDGTASAARGLAACGRDAELDLHVRFAEAHERTNLSAGDFSIARNHAGGVSLRAAWSAASCAAAAAWPDARLAAAAAE